MNGALALSLLILAAPAAALLAYVAHASRQKQKSSRLPLKLVGRVASVESPLAPEGFVLLDGELWRARVRGVDGVGRGCGNVRVVGARDCVLVVEPLG